MIKGKGYAWGLSSVMLAIAFVVLPFALIKPSSWVPLSIIQVVWAFFPTFAFVLAFVGKVRSEQRTKARRLCNIGAGMGWLVSTMLIFAGLDILWTEVVSLPETAAEITTIIDTVLIAGYLLIAYIRGKIFWFM